MSFSFGKWEVSQPKDVDAVGGCELDSARTK